MSIPSGLPINIDDLINQRTVEANRIEYKATLDDYTRESIVRTVSAFANDLLNLNGGYIIIGCEAPEGKPLLPPRGLNDQDLETIQKQVIGACRGGISPEYLPLVFVEKYQDQHLLVISAPAGDNRPYQAPRRKGGERAYFIRSGPETVEAKGDILRQLMELAAKIPFDDRRSLSASMGDISVTRVKKFLEDIRSHLSSIDLPGEEYLRKLRLLVKVNDHEVPRNVAVLFFSDNPEQFFSGVRVEVVQFGDDAGGDLIEEKIFRGPLHEMIHSCLNYLDGIGGAMLRKVEGQAEVERTVPYPYEALREAIVNAVYHRSYEYPPEPIKVYLYPDRMEITNYPGPVSGITLEQIRQGRTVAAPARNRRIGEFLKDLRLAEGRGTGIPKIQRKMMENGSPVPIFNFDEEKTFFQVTLPVHPRYLTLHAIREGAHLWVIGEKEKALNFLMRTLDQQPYSGALAGQAIEYAMAMEKEKQALEILSAFDRGLEKTEALQPSLTLARLLIDRERIGEAQQILNRLPLVRSANEAMEAAHLKNRADDYPGAHKLYTEAYAINQDDPKLLHEFAQTKLKIARNLNPRKEKETKKRLNREAAELFRRAIQLTDDPVRQGWSWYLLADCLNWLQMPKSEVEAAYLKAIALLPNVPVISSSYKKWKRA